MFIHDLPKHNCIKMGNIWIPPSAFEQFIGSSVRLVVNEVPNNPDMLGYLGLGGSATLIRNGKTPFICMTSHQLTEELPLDEAVESVRIGSINSGVLDNITFNQMVSVRERNGEELDDIIFLRPNPEDELYASEYPHYFPLQRLTGKHTKARFVYVGYPFEFSKNLYDEAGKSTSIEAVTVLKDCELNKDFKSDLQHFNHFTYEDDGSELNGISGGAVFGLLKNTDGFEGFLCGVITRAGSGNIYTISANHLLNVG